MRDIKEFFAPGGLLASQFSKYEARPQQLKMAEGVAYAADNNRCALIEAGTGVGKSLGYLIPFLTRIEEDRNVHVEIKDPETGDVKVEDRPRRLIISTGTINLQQQLMDKELPMLRKLFPWLTYAMAIGTENYLCGCRLDRALADVANNPMLFSSVDDLKMIEAWSRKTKTGMRMDLPKTVDHSVWSAVNRQADLCKCKEFTEENRCFYRKARAEINQAHVLVVNHWLLMLGLTVENVKILPGFDYLVIDEVHQLEAIAAQVFGIEVSNFKVKHLVDDSRRFFRSMESGMVKASEAQEILDMIEGGSETLFDTMRTRLRAEDKEVLRLRQPMLAMDQLQNVELITQMDRIAQWLADAAPHIGDDQRLMEVRSLSKRAAKIAGETRRWLTQAEPDHVYQVASESKGKRIVAKSCPVDVSSYLRTCLWGLGVPVIGTSATIATGRSMDFMKRKLGAEAAEEMVLDSPFEYDKNSLIYVASDMPEVKGAKQDAGYYQKITGRVVDLLSITRGRALILCTSNYAMKTMGASLKVMLPDLKIMVQGEDLERHAMVDELKRNPGAVICATESFWHGVDIPGAALVLVIIIKIPFSNPADPLFEAKSEKIDRAAQALGKRQQFMAGSFMSLSVPEATIKLKQGFGRLIRTSTDFGVIAILDPRIVTKKSYGQRMLQSLPRTYVVADLEAVRKFFAERLPPPGSEPMPGVETGEIEEAPF